MSQIVLNTVPFTDGGTEYTIFRKEGAKGSLLSYKWLSIHQYVAYKKIVIFTKTADLRSIGKSLLKQCCKWEDGLGIMII
jgi:hypothetical protein